MRRRMRGVALVTAMLVIAIVAVLSASLSLGQQVWLRQTQNLADLARTERLRQGALEAAAALLTRDARKGPTDDLTEDWAQLIPPLPVEGGTVLISIADAQGRFNLNNLIQPQQGQANATDIAIFRNLLALNELPPGLADTVLDWLDADSTVRPAGAEDLDYLNRDPPYRAANRPLSSVDELRLIEGFTAEIVEQLRPYIIALPVTGRTPINVNTAPAMVLAALTGSSLAVAEQIAQARENRPFASTGEFEAAFGGRTGQAGGYAVASGYFIVSVETRVGRTQRRAEALIQRPPGGNANAQVLWYRQPPFEIILDEDQA